MLEGDEVEPALVDPDAVGGVLRSEPRGEVVCGLDEEELAVVVAHVDDCRGPVARDLAEDPDDEPLVVDGVGDIGRALEVSVVHSGGGGGGGGGGRGQVERDAAVLLVPDVTLRELVGVGEDVGAHSLEAVARVVGRGQVDRVAARVCIGLVR